MAATRRSGSRTTAHVATSPTVAGRSRSRASVQRSSRRSQRQVLRRGHGSFGFGRSRDQRHDDLPDPGVEHRLMKRLLRDAYAGRSGRSRDCSPGSTTPRTSTATPSARSSWTAGRAAGSPWSGMPATHPGRRSAAAERRSPRRLPPGRRATRRCRHHARAFDRYENALGQLVVRCRQAAPTTMKTLIPGTRRQAWLTIQVLPAR
jgi:hypothetical protein